MEPKHTSSTDPVPLDLATAYAELQDLILHGPDVTRFLREVAVLAAAIVPGTHCAITLHRDDQVACVAGSDDVALRMDELQYLRGCGPCREAMRTSQRVDVPDTSTEERWVDYREHALANGVRSAVSLPLAVEGHTVGALSLFSPQVEAFTEPGVARVQAFTDQAATALTILLRHSRHLTLDDELREAMATRAVIDQALGILMHAERISAHEALEMLRHTSQTSNRKVSDLAADIIRTLTGHAPEPPRPLSERG